MKPKDLRNIFFKTFVDLDQMRNNFNRNDNQKTKVTFYPHINFLAAKELTTKFYDFHPQASKLDKNVTM